LLFHFFTSVRSDLADRLPVLANHFPKTIEK